MKGKLDQNTLTSAVKKVDSYAALISLLGYKPSGGMHKFLKQKIALYSLNTDHFKGQGWAKGKTKETCSSIAQMCRHRSLSWDQVFRKGSLIKNQVLLQRLIESGKRKAICERCQNSKWMLQAIPLVVHHKNQANDDNREENLEVICPNCHYLIHHYSSKLRR